MGEYAMLGSAEIKIGTCENMYYLRAGQAHQVRALPDNVDPVRDRDKGIRFRFPFPDEDDVAPGAFDSYERGAPLYLPVPTDIEHAIVQFTTPGYNVCLPCPESGRSGSGERVTDPIEIAGLKVFRNSHPGTVLICQQRWIGKALVLVLACGGCGAKWRCPTIEDARPYIDACLRKADEFDGDKGTRFRFGTKGWWREVAARIEAGYRGEAF
jgi:hypothetical protein